MFLRSLMYSPIIFLSKRWFSRSHWATWLLSMGSLRRPFSCRNWMPFLGFWLNCSVPVMSSWRRKTKIQDAAACLPWSWRRNTVKRLLTFFFALISSNSCESGKSDEKRCGFRWVFCSPETNTFASCWGGKKYVRFKLCVKRLTSIISWIGSTHFNLVSCLMSTQVRVLGLSRCQTVVQSH